MNQTVRPLDLDISAAQRNFHLEVAERREVIKLPCWRAAFNSEHKDSRYYELVEDSLHSEFEYHYFVLRDAHGNACAIAPFFVLDQDMLAGTDRRFGTLIDGLRRLWPLFLRVRTLMVGCVAGEGHLDGGDNRRAFAECLASLIPLHARMLGAPLVVLKEFSWRERPLLDCFTAAGFTRIPSMPMTRLNIDYTDFDDYMNRALSSRTRRDLRRKFRIAEAADLQLSIMTDISPLIEQVYPLYLQVYERSKLHFEKLTKPFFCELGRRMGDKTRFFVWRRRGRIVAFALCMVHGDTIHAEYIGLDYEFALRLHLYHYAFRSVASWAMANGYKWFSSSGLNYDPKLHLRHALEPLDLYVRHTSPAINAMLKRVLPLIEPTHHDATLPRFSNYGDIWGGAGDRPAPKRRPREP